MEPKENQELPEQPAAGEQDLRGMLIALTQRIYQLERQVAQLQGRAGLRPAATPPTPVFAAPPPVAETRPAPTEAQPQHVPDAPRASFENRLGSQIFNRVGVIILLIGVAYFLRLAVDRGWIVPSPTGRVIAGLLAGAGIVLWSERFRRKGFAAFSYSLKALGSGVLYLSLWASFQMFHLLPAGVAFGLMVLVTAWNAWMAWSQDSELLAGYALAGGFLTPLLLSTGGDHEIFLFSYLLAIDLATVLLVRLKPWPRLLLGAFPLTMAFFVAWYAEFYRPVELAATTVFILAFDSTFSSVAIRGVEGVRARLAVVVEDILLPLANSAFLGLALYSVLQDSGHHDLLPWLMLLLAATYLGFMRLPQSRVASAIHLSIAIVFLTIAVPLKASGHWITATWLVEGLALLWVSIRLDLPATEIEDPSGSYASRTLHVLASGALLLGFGGIVTHALLGAMATHHAFFGADTGTALTGICVFAGAVWLTLRGESVGLRTLSYAAFGAISMTAVLLALREISVSWTQSPATHAAFANADFGAAVLGLATVAGAVLASLRVAESQPGISFWPTFAGINTVVFNLFALLTGVREISAIWEGTAATPDGSLQQALAISAFLMLYGAALLALGFWRRSAFLRWQALLLLVFSIFKTFLYDMRNLSQGYRVVSFMGLGALLMTISFAYQKDWLGLREPAPAPPEGSR